MFESSTTRLTRDIRVSSLEQKKTANFAFEFAVDQPNIYSTFCDRIIQALETKNFNSNISALVLNVTAGEDTFTVTGDSQLRTALMSSLIEETFSVAVSTRRRTSNILGASSIMSKGIQVTVTYIEQNQDGSHNNAAAEHDAEQASFRYRFFAGQENLLDNVKEECLDALDMFGCDASSYQLYFKLDGEWIQITGDRAVLEVLSMLTEAGTTTLDIRMSQTPIRAPVTVLNLRCIFNGVLRESSNLPVSDDLIGKYLETLTLECKALWDDAEFSSEPVTLFDATVPPTDYNKRAMIQNENEAEDVVEAAVKSNEKTLLIRMEKGKIVLPSDKSSPTTGNNETVSTHINVLYLDSETNSFEKEAEFDFAWPKNAANGAFTALADKIRALLHLTVPFDLFLGADSQGEIPPQSVKTDLQVLSFLINAPANSQLFCVKNSLHQDADAKLSPLPVGRASYLRALCQDWRQILPRQITGKEPLRITSEDMKPIISTWHLTWELKRRELVLLQQYEDFCASVHAPQESSVPLDELFSVLMRWTSYLVDDEVADFARHGQNMIDYLTEISNEARCLRLSAKCFSALRSTGNIVNPDLLVRALVASGTVGRQEAQFVADGYSKDGVEAWEVDEILTYFFLDDSAAFTKMLAACSTLRTSPDYSQHDFQMRSVRETRLRSELRHALDGVVSAHLTRFSKENWGFVATGKTVTVPQNLLDLAWCVAGLLNHFSATIPNEASNVEKGDSAEIKREKALHEAKLNAWKWMIGECAKSETAENFLTIIRSTGLSFCHDSVLQRVGVIVFNDGLDARLLHATAGAFLSNLAQWSYVLQDLSFLTRNLQVKIEDIAQDPVVTAADREPVTLHEGKQSAENSTPSKHQDDEASSSCRNADSPSRRVHYSPPRATMGLRPTPPSTNSSRSIAVTNTTAAVAPTSPRFSRIVSPTSTRQSAGYGLTGTAPQQDLSELLRLQKEENLLREFDGSGSALETQRAILSSEKEARDSKHPPAATEGATGNNAKVRNHAEFALFTIRGAAGLAKHPMIHSVDSYVVAYDPAGAVVHQTPVIEGTSSPQYPSGSRFVVPLNNGEGSVVFHILTESNISGFLGEATFKLSEAQYGGTREVCLKIKPRRGETDELLIENSRDLGHLTVEVVPLKEPIFLPRGEPGFVVFGKIVGCDQVGAPEAGERRDLYVQILDKADCPIRRTDASRDPQKPRWNGINSDFIVPLENAIETLSFKLIDEDLKGGRVFGVATLPASSLVRTQEDLQKNAPATKILPVKPDYATSASSSSLSGSAEVSSKCTMTLLVRVLGPLPDDLAWRKRQEEAKRIAQQRADEMTEEKRKREVEAYERMLEDQDYIQAAEREAQKQRAHRAENEKKKEEERFAKREEENKQKKIAEAQQNAKKAALAAAKQDEQDESSQRRQAQKERAAAAESEERKRMAAIDMQKMLNEDEMRERIRKQLEKEDEDRKKHDALLEEERKKKAAENKQNNNNNNNSEAGKEVQQAHSNEGKSQQEIAEHAAKAEVMKALHEEAAAQKADEDRKARVFLEQQQESPRRDTLSQDYAKSTNELVQQISKERERIVDKLKVVVEEEPVAAVVTPAKTTTQPAAAEQKQPVSTAAIPQEQSKAAAATTVSSPPPKPVPVVQDDDDIDEL